MSDAPSTRLRGVISSGPGRGCELSTSDELIAAAYLVGFVVPSLAVAIRLAFRWSEDGLDRTFLASFVFILQAVGVPLVLAMAGALERNTALGTHLVLAAVVLAFVPGPTGDQARSPLSREALAGFGAVAGFLALSVLLSLRGQTVDFDSRNYHLPHVGHWLEQRSFWRFAFQLPGVWTSAHPSNGEILGVWLALPSHGDELAILAPTLFALLGILAVAFLCRELGGRAGVGALAGVAVFAAPILFQSQVRSLATDNAAAACWIAAAALLVRGVRNADRLWIGAAGVALGLGLGSKYTSLVPGAALFVAGVALLWRSRRWLWLIPGIVIFFSPWLVRNAIETGNPLWPQRVQVAGIQVFEGGESPINAFSTPVGEYIVEGKWSVMQSWASHVARYVGPVALLAAVGVVLGLRRAAPNQARILSLVAIVAFIGYLATPFSGGGPDGTIVWLLLNIRYAFPALLLGVALYAGLARGPWAVWPTLAALGFDAVRIMRGTPLAAVKDLLISGRLAILVLLIAAVAVLIATRVTRLPAAWFELARRRAGGALAGAALLLVLVAAAYHGADGRYRPTPLEALVDRARGSTTLVEVIGAKDVRSLMGRRYDVSLRATRLAARLDRPSSAFIDAGLRDSPAQILVVSSQPTYGVPAGYTPPSDWCLFGKTRFESVYLRSDRCPATPP